MIKNTSEIYVRSAFNIDCHNGKTSVFYAQGNLAAMYINKRYYDLIRYAKEGVPQVVVETETGY